MTANMEEPEAEVALSFTVLLHTYVSINVAFYCIFMHIALLALLLLAKCLYRMQDKFLT